LAAATLFGCSSVVLQLAQGLSRSGRNGRAVWRIGVTGARYAAVWAVTTDMRRAAAYGE
jgi:hypothetical protein